jgi:kynureninase
MLARRGVHMVATDGVHVPLQPLLEAIDEETLLVPVSHVFRSACLQDARAIVEKAHRVGARVLLDTYHGGHHPLRRAGAQCGLRHRRRSWICGGPGVGYL